MLIVVAVDGVPFLVEVTALALERLAVFAVFGVLALVRAGFCAFAASGIGKPDRVSREKHKIVAVLNVDILDRWTVFLV